MLTCALPILYCSQFSRDAAHSPSIPPAHLCRPGCALGCLRLVARRASCWWATWAGWPSPVGLAGSILMSSLGFMLQTLGLKDGNTVIVCTCAAVSSMGTGCQPATLPLSYLSSTQASRTAD